MSESKYEKYVTRKPIPPESGVKWGIPELGVLDLKFALRLGGPLKEANTMIEYSWIVKDGAFGVTEDKPPHKHPCDEIFWFLGTNPDNPDDLGGEVEFWMGEREDAEVIKLNTSGVIFTPKDTLHLPVFFKNVKRPLLWVIIALDIEKTLPETKKYPVRGV